VKLSESLRNEFEHEAQTTRRHLERLPDAKWDWRPHPKSFTAGDLASHLVSCLDWVESVFTQDELEVDPASYRPFQAGSAAELLKGFDDRVARGRKILDGVSDSALAQPWRLKMRGKVWFEKPRAAVFRDMTLSHMIHHRGQFSVYLRLLEIPVPGSYGPTADEKF
jgi:uncharacterized damage-inducible protein DinB